jgi:hypothetical protein
MNCSTCGVFEFLSYSPASYRKWRKAKCWMWDSKLWLGVSRASETRMIRLARTSSDCKRPNRPLVPSSQRELSTATNPELSDSNKNLVVSPRWVLYSKTVIQAHSLQWSQQSRCQSPPHLRKETDPVSETLFSNFYNTRQWMKFENPIILSALKDISSRRSSWETVFYYLCFCLCPPKHMVLI